LKESKTSGNEQKLLKKNYLLLSPLLDGTGLSPLPELNMFKNKIEKKLKKN
jgi:hypothetical protein